MTQASSSLTELRVNDRSKDKMYLVRNEKADGERRAQPFLEGVEEEIEEQRGQESDVGEHDDTTSEESDEDTEGIVDALLAEYTRG